MDQALWKGRTATARRADPEPAQSTAATVLVGDFDEAFGEIIETILRASGRHVIRVRDGRQAWNTLLSNAPALVVVPAESHSTPLLDAVRRIRMAGERTGIIAIARPGERNEGVRQLRMGADDFLTRPIEPLELECRVNAVLSRVRASMKLVRCGGRVTIEPALHSLSLDGQSLILPPREFSVMWILAVHLPSPVRTPDIACAMFQTDAAKCRAEVHVLVAMLRRRLERFEGHLTIRTIPNAGYTLELVAKRPAIGMAGRGHSKGADSHEAG